MGYEEICKYFKKNGIEILSSKEEYDISKTIKWKCYCGKISNGMEEYRYHVSHVYWYDKCYRFPKQLDNYGIEWMLKCFRESIHKKCSIYYIDVDILDEQYKNKHSDILHISHNRRIKYQTKSEKTIRIDQGLVKIFKKLLEKYEEEDMITDIFKVPGIVYEYGEKKYVYYPSIYIFKENKIIETRFSLSFQNHIGRPELIRKAVIKAGYIFELLR